MNMLIKGGNVLPNDIRNILLIQLGDIGDVVLSLPTIRALRENFPQANLIVAVMEKAGGLVEKCPWVRGVIAIKKNRWKWYKEITYQKAFFSHLRKYRFDMAVDLRTGTRGAILAFLSGARLRIGYYTNSEKPWRNRMFTHLHKPEPRPGWHLTEFYQGILRDFNVSTEKIWPEIRISVERQQSAEAFFRKENIPLDRPIIAVQPFSLWKYKEWSIAKYIELISRITTEYKLTVILTGSSDEQRRAEEIAKKCGQDVFNLAGKTSIGMLSAVLKMCDLFVGGDSAGVHISAAVGIPTVSIFGPTAAFAWAPRGEKHSVIQKELPCVPCNLKGCDGKGISQCLEELTVDEVVPAVKVQLDRIIHDFRKP
ncbi:glycosyltransferase family 9 protein [Thermodesulfobacteriota bacterium]